MVIPFDSGSKPLNEYAPRELLWGAQMQAQHAADELRYLAANPTSVLPTIYVAIDAGDGGAVVVGWCDATKKASYYFAKAQLVDDGDASNDLTLLGQTEGFSIALLALKARIGTAAVNA